MINLPLNKEINGEQFLQELKSAGVNIPNDVFPTVENGSLFIDVDYQFEKKVVDLWDAHIAEDWANKKIESRKNLLDKLGITEEEAKLLFA